jgi:polysaccharide deacetylase family protein (PEP-CTERM system associated)
MTPAVSRDEWADCESRVETPTRRILDLLDRYDTRATFFVLGWVAERHPELVREIDRRGHELASHGYNHRLLYDQTPSEVRADLNRSLEILQDLTDQPIEGYRAPSFSITDWASDLLAELEFTYDSSSLAAPGHDRYGRLEDNGKEPVTALSNGLTEVGLPVLDLPLSSIPWAGGGYFRFIPYPAYRRGVRHICADQPFVFYLHPWELDPDQPRQTDLPWSYRVRHYTNLNRTERRLERLLVDFDWEPIERAL